MKFGDGVGTEVPQKHTLLDTPLKRGTSYKLHYYR